MKSDRSTAPPIKALLVLIFALIPALGFAIEEPPTKDLPNRIAAVEALNEQIAQAAEKLSKQDWTAALPLLNAVVESPVFDDLPVERRHVLLIRRLNDPLTRADALTEVQNYADPTDLSWPVKSEERFRAVKNRNDVQRAISQVGRIESFNLRSDLP